ncbi:MAG: thioredoxin family protein [Acidobacteria bacterium]|nr:thioredoxin family protein [Acidobacteriota bacterium]
MRVTHFALSLLVVLASTSSGALTVGEVAPSADVKMLNVDGRELSIADVKGARGTLVVFTCNHCPYAKAWEQRLVSIGNAYRENGFGVIAVNPNDAEAYEDDSYPEMQKRAKEKGYAFPYVVDATSGVAKAFGATRTPEVFVFDAGGKLVYHGAIDDNAEDAAKVTKAYLRDALDAVTGGSPVRVAETKAIGCSIKFR